MTKCQLTTDRRYLAGPATALAHTATEEVADPSSWLRDQTTDPPGVEGFHHSAQCQSLRVSEADGRAAGSLNHSVLR